MEDSFGYMNIPFFWLISLLIIILLFGTVGYVIVTRKFKQPIVHFLIRYIIFFLLLFFVEYAILSLSPSLHAEMRNLTANLVGSILTFAGVNHSISGPIIMLQNPTLTFDITVACLGGLLFWAYTALILAESRASNKQRLIGIFAGLVILVGFNFLRITLSVYLEWLTGFSLHNLFYGFNMIFVLLVWAAWLMISKRKISKRAGLVP